MSDYLANLLKYYGKKSSEKIRREKELKKEVAKLEKEKEDASK